MGGGRMGCYYSWRSSHPLARRPGPRLAWAPFLRLEWRVVEAVEAEEAVEAVEAVQVVAQEKGMPVRRLIPPLPRAM